MTLTEGIVGKEYLICDITEGADVQRLFAFGVMKGGRLTLQGIAPGKGAYLVVARGSAVVIDRETASHIAVRAC